MPNNPIQVSLDAQGVARLTIDRKEALNALNQSVLEALASELHTLGKNPALRLLYIQGAGDRAFVAGADITEMQALSAKQAHAFSRQGLETLALLEQLPVPVIALVGGFCLGGGFELALACDWIIATEAAVFAHPEVGLGIIPGFGGTQRLPRRIGPAAALDLIMTGRRVKAEEALRLGIAQHLTCRDALEETVAQFSQWILRNAPNANHAAKAAVYQGEDLPQERALQLEASLFGACFAGEEQPEGMCAFLEKRKPKFAD
jgi:enoyl-CoA hydratase